MLIIKETQILLFIYKIKFDLESADLKDKIVSFPIIIIYSTENKNNFMKNSK